MRLKQIQKDLVEALGASKPKTSGYDTEATVIRTEGQTAWVHIPGGIDETPVAMTINSKRGDKVRVRVSGGTAWLIGNDSAPPTDDRKAIEAAAKADDAQKVADSAKEGAEAAWEYAGIAKTAATTANDAANNALTQLSVVEDVAGTLAWIQEHGSYVQSTDTAVVPGTIYFILQDGDYVPIANPDPSANPAAAGWYVLDITDSQSQYIMAHLAVTSAGLWVLPTSQYAEVALTDENDDQLVNEDDDTISVWTVDPQNADGYKVLLSGTGMTVYDGSGASVAFYGETMTIGRTSGNHVYIDSDSVDIKAGDVTRASYGAETNFYDANGEAVLRIGYVDGKPFFAFGNPGEIGTEGKYSVTEGTGGIASGNYSHSEGYASEATGEGAHASGYYTEASGDYSTTHGRRTVADQDNQTAIGKFNTTNNTNNLFAVGNGTANDARSDAFTVDTSGNAVVKGALTAGNIDAGLTSSTVDTAAGTYQDVNIAFHKTFASAPIVVVGFDTTGTQANFGMCCVAVVNGTITTTGFTARVFNADSAVRKPRVSWIAIGV